MQMKDSQFLRRLLLAAALVTVGCAADDDDDDGSATVDEGSNNNGGTGGDNNGGTGGDNNGGTGGDNNGGTGGDNNGGTGGDNNGGTGGDNNGGTGGDNNGGTGGDNNGGNSGPPSVCDDNAFPPASAQLSDLENGEATNWDIYASTESDATMGAVLTAPASGSFNDPPEIANEGGNDTSSSIHFAGTGWATYGAGLNFNLEGCKDLSAYTGVRFWAKGTTSPSDGQTKPPNLKPNVLNFRVITAGSHAIILDENGVNVGGDCDASKQPNKCFMPPQKDIELTEEWTLYEIPFASLVTPAGANPGSAFSGTNAMLLGWHSSNGDFDFYIDEVEFY